MTTILVGNDTSDRASSVGDVYTYIETTWPCDGTGHISTVNFRMATAGSVKAATFQPLGNNVWRCRSSADLGSRGVGVHSVTDLNLLCYTGDCLGLYVGSGSLDALNTGGTGMTRCAGDATTPDAAYAFSVFSTFTLSLGGSGVTEDVGEHSSEIYAMFDLVRDEYLGATRQWLTDNIGFLSFADYQLALMMFTALNAGGPGSLYTGPTLQQIKDVLGTPYETTLADQHTAILQSFSDQHTEQNDEIALIRYDLENTEGVLNSKYVLLDSAIEASKDLIQGVPATDLASVLTAVEGVSVPEGVALTTDVTSAVGTLTGEIGEAVTTIDGHTDVALAALAFATPADVTAAHATTDGKIDALNNLSELAVSTLVDAAVGTVTGEISEAVNVLSGLISAIDPDTDTRYPGYELTTRGTTVRVTSQGTISATTHGVGGKMEGVLLSMVSVPSRCTEKVVESISNYRYPGWIVFADSQGNCDEPQWCNIDARVYAPKGIKEPSFCICGFADGVVADVTPWIVT